MGLVAGDNGGHVSLRGECNRICPAVDCLGSRRDAALYREVVTWVRQYRNTMPQAGNAPCRGCRGDGARITAFLPCCRNPDAVA